jgi:signal transduction histidine kinase
MPSGRIGLRGRLALSIAAILVIALGVLYFAVYRSTGSELRSRIDRDLRSETNAVARRLAGAGSPRAARQAARRFIAAQPFGPSARLLIVNVPGAPPISNEPELVGARSESGESRTTTENERAEARDLRTAPPGYSEVELEDAGSVRLLTRKVPLERGAPAMVRAGEPLESVERAQSEVSHTFLLIGAITLAVALLAGYLVAVRTATPLRRMARTAAAVDAGDLTHRIGSDGLHDEMRLLAESFDHMLERLDDAFSRQREFVSDASHELRTPLTAIRGQLEVLAREPDPSPHRVRQVERTALREIDRMQRLVDDLLTLAQIDEGAQPVLEEMPIKFFLADLLEGAASGHCHFELGQVPRGTLRADPDRLAQLVRNLLRNASEHCGPSGRVRLGAEALGNHLRVCVDDDGPGIPAAERERVFDRFHRVEASRSRSSGGSGLGLAIARDIVVAHGGSIGASDSPLGGARICFELPGFRAAS